MVPTILGEFQPLTEFVSSIKQTPTDRHLAYNHQLTACSEAQKFSKEVPCWEIIPSPMEKLDDSSFANNHVETSPIYGIRI